MSKVYNRSKEIYEDARQDTCPRCKGFGGLHTDDEFGCPLCNGKGILWVAKSGSGWTRIMFDRMEHSTLY